MGSSWIKNPPTIGIISDSGKVYVKGQEQLENKDALKTVDSENAKYICYERKHVYKKIEGTETVLLEKYYNG